MSQHPHDSFKDEQALLQHYRRHSQGEPSAALDALILDAARQAVEQPAVRPGRFQRLHGWLFGAGSRLRWSVAFASLATVGLGLSLTMRTLDNAPQVYDQQLPQAIAPAAPMPAPAMREAPGNDQLRMERKVEPRARLSADPSMMSSAPAMADERAAARPAPPALTKKKDGAEEPPQALLDALQGVDTLRLRGDVEKADESMARLREQYSQDAIEAALKRLAEEQKTPAISR